MLNTSRVFIESINADQLTLAGESDTPHDHSPAISESMYSPGTPSSYSHSVSGS